MPNFKTHLAIGAGAGAIYSVGTQSHRRNSNPFQPLKCDPIHIAACSVAAAIGACFPDWLEPASREVGPNHRCKFHSVAAGVLAVTYSIKATACPAEHPLGRFALDVLCAFYVGYASHLAADAVTPNGIGFLYKRF